ncbi:MAG: SIMPL domain-containing protein [Bacteroidales bacterium]|jgi:hypothetical protein|nr:SIMPL domain-containing protein [Bacteroidales bacterium]
MKTKSNFKLIVAAIIFVFGAGVLGFFIYKGLKTFSDKDRVVTVKGLAEMNIKAESATISVYYSFSGDHLKELISKTDNKKEKITKYLNSIGIKTNAIKVKNLNVQDRQRYYTTQWRNGQEVEVKIDRYTVGQMLTLISKDIKKTEDLAAKIKLDLISKDLTSEITTDYKFPDLNTIKPQLIAESTKNARIAGEQFANDSEAKLGKIKTASQGQITLAGRYYYDEDDVISNKPEEPYLQKARVVSTIVFFLE